MGRAENQAQKVKPAVTVGGEVLLREASRGEVRAISELANPIEGKSLQALAVNAEINEGIAERLAKARQRELEALTARRDRRGDKETRSSARRRSGGEIINGDSHACGFRWQGQTQNTVSRSVSTFPSIYSMTCGS